MANISRLSLALFILLTGTFVAFQNCAPTANSLGQTSSNSSGDAQGEEQGSSPVEAACIGRKRENHLTVNLPGTYAPPTFAREVVVKNLNFSQSEELRYHSCDYSFENSDFINWTQNEDEAVIEILFNDELNDYFFNEDGSVKKGETFHYSYQVTIHWYPNCESTESSPTGSSASQQFAWEDYETYIDEDGCEVDRYKEYSDFFQIKTVN